MHGLVGTDDGGGDVREQGQAGRERRLRLAGRVEQDVVGPSIERQRGSHFGVDLPKQP